MFAASWRLESRVVKISAIPHKEGQIKLQRSNNGNTLNTEFM